MRGTLSARCSTAWRRNEISCQSNMLLPLVHALLSRHAASKQTPPYPWALRKRSKLNSISVWYSLTQYNISKQKRLHRSIFLPNWIFPADWRVCFQVLVVLFLPNVQTWMRTVYTQDLTPFWNTIHTYTYKYSLLAIQLLSPKTKTCIINRCLKWLMFLTIQCINLPKIALPQRPGLQRNMYAYTYLSWMAAPLGPTTEFETYKMICLRGACQVDR